MPGKRFNAPRAGVRAGEFSDHFDNVFRFAVVG